MPEFFFANFTHSPPEVAWCSSSQASHASRDSNEMTGRSALAVIAPPFRVPARATYLVADTARLCLKCTGPYRSFQVEPRFSEPVSTRRSSGVGRAWKPLNNELVGVVRETMQ